MFYLNIILIIVTFSLTLLMVYSSIVEKNLRATLISTIILTINSFMWWIFLNYHQQTIVYNFNILFYILVSIFTILTLIKKNPEIEKVDEMEIDQFDERDHMFSRHRLKDNPDLANKYYVKFPEKWVKDKANQEKPGLLSENSKYYDRFYSKAADSVFNVVSKSHHLTVGEVSKDKQQIDKNKLFEIIFNLAKYYGAVDLGVTELKNHHIYSHHGRHAEQWGEKIELTHKFAITIVVKMNLDMIENSPATPAILESSRQYLESAKIAYILSDFIRSLGYDAKAHVDGKYDVICSPIAEDSNLGAVGRMGIFMHKIYGPSVRISVITTDVEIKLTENQNFSYMEEFCGICKKCADNCPTGSILKGEKESSRGFKHWSVDQEKCFSYWNTIGTDCAFCIKTCPFTKPNTLLHKMARWYISRNQLNRHLALLADDLLYGRKFKICNCNPKKMVSF